MSNNPKISIRAYRAAKRQLIELELENYDSILAIPCSGDKEWYEIAEHSALIYHARVCEKLHLRTKFFSDDYSYYDRYNIGYMRTRGLDTIRNNLKRADIYDSESNLDLICIFKLNTTFSKKQVKEFLLAETERRKQNLAPEPPNNLDPELHHILADAAARLHRLCNSNLDALNRVTNGHKIIRLIDSALFTYHAITYYKPNQNHIITEKLTQMHKNLLTLIIEIQILGETKLWDLTVCSSIATPLIKADDIVKRHIKKLSHHPERAINPKPTRTDTPSTTIESNSNK